MNLIKGTTKTYNGVSYAAKVAFNSKFVDYLKENADLEAELMIDPDQSQGLSSNASFFGLNEVYADVKELATLKTKEIISVSVEKIDFADVETHEVSISADKVVFISNRPLFSTAYKSSQDDSDVSGGMGSGTYVLTSTAKNGLVLYWTSEEYEDVLDNFTETAIIYVASGSDAILAVPNSFYVVTTKPDAGSARLLRLPDAAACKGATVTVVKLAGLRDLSVNGGGVDGLDTINGVGSKTLLSPYDRITVFSTGVEWIIKEMYID